MNRYKAPKFWLFLSVPSFLALLFLPLLASELSVDPPEATISTSEVAKHIRFLASDELMGREAGTLGNDVASRYIAEVFRSHGLKPVSGSGDYFQLVTLEREYPPEEQELILMGRRLERGDDFILLSGSKASVEGAVVDVGFGLERTDASELSGKIALARFGSPEGGNPMSVMRRKRDFLSENGAVAIIEIYSGPMWERFGRFLSGGRMSLARANVPNEGSVPHLLIRAAKEDWGSLVEQSASPGAKIRISAKRIEKLTSRNVVGISEGADPEMKGQFIALTAHYDHVGIRPAHDGSSQEDRIYNGARDNGMGTTALLAAARTLSESPPARSVLFIAFTAEEKGLLGSRFYVSDPSIPLANTIYVLNNDGAGYTNSSLVTLLGLGRTTATKWIQEACQRFDLRLAGPPEGLERLFRQSDNIVFAEKGVPAVTFSPGFESFGPKIREFYHQVNDHADETFDFEYLRQFARAYAFAARLIANAPDRPQWATGDEFSDEAEELYRSQIPSP